MRNIVSVLAVIVSSAGALLLDAGGPPEGIELKSVGAETLLSTKGVPGDYSFRCEADITDGVDLIFNGDKELANYCVYSIKPGEVSLSRVVKGKNQFLRKEMIRPAAGFREIRFEKRGIYCFLSFDKGGRTWGAHVGGDVYYSVPNRPFEKVFDVAEPASGYVGIRAIKGTLKTKAAVANAVAFIKNANQLVIGPSNVKGAWNETQVIPGAVLEAGNGIPYKDKSGFYYMYVNCSDAARPDQESGGKVVVGLVRSKDLSKWEWANAEKPVLAANKEAWDGISVFVNGALAVPTDKYPGKFVIFYAGYNGSWNGQGLAWSDNPEGPFTKDKRNPVIEGKTAAHEGHLTRIDDTFHYFRTVFHEGSDRAFHSTSTDLVHWKHDPTAIFEPRPGDWDGVHVRPRSVLKFKDMYYLFYEGAAPDAKRATAMPDRWWDSVGLARSKDLIHWERSPLNPLIVARPGAEGGTIWTGWPRAIVNGDSIFVYHSLGGYDFLKPTHQASTALTVLPASVLAESAWKSD